MEAPPRTVLVTGASRGIGQATADAFVAAGWRVVAGMRDPAGATDAPGRHVVRLDVTDPASVRDAVGTAHEIADGPLACLVSNAGWALFGAVEDVDLDIARRQFETNLFGAVAVMQAAVPAMRRAGSGVIVGVSSLSGRIPVPLFGMYSGSKLALAAVLQALALELGSAGVRAVLIEAGVVRTELARSTIVSGSAGEPESPYADARAGVLGTLRGIREECGLEAHEVADAIVAAVEDDGAPTRPAPVGREAEVAAIGGLLSRASAGESDALALIGSAGTGKTTLLREAEALAASGENGLRVLRARGIESEAELAFGGLLELVRPVADLIPRLPGPQAQALEGALALAPAAGTDRFSVAAATLGILGLAAADGPLLVAVDDLHWLDPPSAQAILFAARRLWREGIAMLLCARPEDMDPRDLEGIDRVEVGPLGRRDSADLARRVADRGLNDEDVEALFLGTGGNPLAIIEATRSLGGAGDALAGVILPLPVAERIRAGVERRLAALGAAEQAAVLTAAAAGTEAPCALVGSALATVGLSLEALGAAEATGLLRLRGGTVAFDHPLTRSAVYATAPGAQQRRAHRALAEVSPVGSAGRAWHLSAAAVGADADAAAALERWGEDALARGAPSSALRAFDRAASLSETADESGRRLLRGAAAARLAGMTDRAREAIAQARERTSDPLVRADALTLLFQIDAWSAPVATARLISAEAERTAALDPARAARMLAEAATALIRSASMSQGVDLAERALAQARAHGRPDDAVEVAVLFARVADGRAPEAVDGLHEVGERLLRVDPPGAQTAALLHQVAWLHIWTERYEHAARLLERAVEQGRGQAPGTLPMALAMRAELGYRRSQWSVALADATESASLAAAFEQVHARGLALACQARVEACLGREADCRVSAAEAAAIGRRLGGEGSPISAWGSPALGLLELGRGRPDEATPHFQVVADAFARGGVREPSVVLTGGDLVECLVRTGRRADAEDALSAFEDLARRAERIGARAIAARCRGLLADDDGFEGPFEQALVLHRDVDAPFEEARTLLCLGERLRRARRRADARVHLRAALDAFEGLGAADWAATARGELGVTGETAAPRSGPRSDALTPQELQVALMVASGVTNREAGSRLFLSAKTIEAHLGRIYRKLGVRSRTELAALVAHEGLGADTPRSASAVS